MSDLETRLDRALSPPGGKVAATMARKATGGSDLWETPGAVLQRVHRMGHGDSQFGIELDPCSTKGNPTAAVSHVWPPDGDGLAFSWVDHLTALPGNGRRGVTFVNPPYSQMATWAAKVAHEAEEGCQIVSLVAARPDTRWWRRMVWDTATSVCFWSGRLTFVGAPSVAPFPSAVVLHGTRAAEFELAFRDAGRVVRLK